MSRSLAKILERAGQLRNTPYAAEASRQVRIAVRAAHTFPFKGKVVDNADRRLRKMLSSLKK